MMIKLTFPDPDLEDPDLRVNANHIEFYWAMNTGQTRVRLHSGFELYVVQPPNEIDQLINAALAGTT